MYRAFLAVIACMPMIGLSPRVDFSQVMKVYSIIGAWFMPMLALALLIMNGRSAWVGRKARNRPLTVAILTATLAFFAYVGWLETMGRISG